MTQGKSNIALRLLPYSREHVSKELVSIMKHDLLHHAPDKPKGISVPCNSSGQLPPPMWHGKSPVLLVFPCDDSDKHAEQEQQRGLVRDGLFLPCGRVQPKTKRRGLVTGGAPEPRKQRAPTTLLPLPAVFASLCR
jgi:hypothetical protein